MKLKYSLSATILLVAALAALGVVLVFHTTEKYSNKNDTVASEVITKTPDKATVYQLKNNASNKNIHTQSFPELGIEFSTSKEIDTLNQYDFGTYANSEIKECLGIDSIECQAIAFLTSSSSPADFPLFAFSGDKYEVNGPNPDFTHFARWLRKKPDSNIVDVCDIPYNSTLVCDHRTNDAQVKYVYLKFKDYTEIVLAHIDSDQKYKFYTFSTRGLNAVTNPENELLAIIIPSIRFIDSEGNTISSKSAE